MMYWALFLTLVVATTCVNADSVEDDEKFIAEELTKATDELADEAGVLKPKDFDHKVKNTLDSKPVMEKSIDMLKTAITPEWKAAHSLGENDRTYKALSDAIYALLGPLDKATAELVQDEDFKNRHVNARQYIYEVLKDQLNVVEVNVKSGKATTNGSS